MQTSNKIQLTLKVWRQQSPDVAGGFSTISTGPISRDISFLEMLDIVNEQLTTSCEEPIAFDHDCREGICGMCGAMVNGQAHGPEKETTLCQLHMRHFKDGDTLTIEPFRARPFTPIKDLIIDRSALDDIITAGGYISVSTGGAPDGNAIAVFKDNAERALDAAACIGCAACIAACPNASAMLFVGAKISHLALLPQGKHEQSERAVSMIRKMDEKGFGNCGNERECEASCPEKYFYHEYCQAEQTLHQGDIHSVKLFLFGPERLFNTIRLQPLEGCFEKAAEEKIWLKRYPDDGESLLLLDPDPVH